MFSFDADFLKPFLSMNAKTLEKILLAVEYH